MRFLDKYSVLLLDMNGTFMFGHDRLGNDQDYYATYQMAGGLNPDQSGVTGIINAAVAALSAAYLVSDSTAPGARRAAHTVLGAAYDLGPHRWMAELNRRVELHIQGRKSDKPGGQAPKKP